MRQFLIALLLLVAQAAGAQTKVGGFTNPPPWPSVAMTPNEISNGSMENCSGGPCTGAGQTLASWTSTACTIKSDTVAAGGHVHSGTYSMKVTGCGSSAANGLVQQTMTYQGLGNNLLVCFYAYTSSDFTAPSGMDGPWKAFGVDLTDTDGRRSGQTNGGTPLTIPGNSGGWFHSCMETVVNQYPYGGITFTMQLRFPIPGMTGTIWLDDITVVENDDPIRLFVTSNMDGTKGYYFADMPIAPNRCANHAVSGQICGVIEVNIPAGSSSVSAQVKVDSTPGCPGGVSVLSSIISSATVQKWIVDPQAAPLSFPIETSPTTPRYICSSAHDNTTGLTFNYPDYVFYVLDNTFRSTLVNYIDYDGVRVSNGKRIFGWGAYESCTSTNCQGSAGGGPFSLASPGITGNPVTSYLERWAGQGPHSPQSIICNSPGPPNPCVSATHSGAQITVQGPYRAVDWAANYFNWLLDFVDATTMSPIAGSGDQLGPFIQNMVNYGLSHIQITNNLFGTGWDGGANVTAATIPPTPCNLPTPPSPCQPSIVPIGNINNTQVANNYLWLMECPLFWGSLGQQGNTLLNGACSQAFVTTTAFPVSGTSSVSVPMLPCNNFRQQGWMIAGALSNSHILAPSGDTFFPIMDANTTANGGWLDCSSRGGPSTLTIIGSPGDGNSLGQLSIIAPANDPRTLTFTSANCTANCGVPSATHGGSTVVVDVFAKEIGGVTEPSLPGVFLYSNNGTLTANGTTTVTSNNSPAPFCTGSGSESNLNGETITINATNYTIISLTCPNTMVVSATVPTSTLVPWSLQPTVVMPSSLGGFGTAAYICIANASGTAQPNPWHFYLQQAIGSPLAASASYLVPSQNLFSTNIVCPADLTNIGRTGWNAGFSDTAIIGDLAGLADGGDQANFPGSKLGFLGNYTCDECGPMHAWAGSFQQNLTPSTGWLAIAPGTLTTSVSTTPADYKYHRDSVDVAGHDPYCCGRLATSDLVMNGGSCRNDLLYEGTNNTPPVLTSGCSTGGSQLTPQQTDVAALGCVFANYGSRPCHMVLDYFQAVSVQKGYSYGTLRRACWKGIIDIKSFGDNGFDCIWWDWGNGVGADAFWYTFGNTQVWQNLQTLGAQTNAPQMVRALLAPVVDGSGTQSPGFNTPGLGHIILTATPTVTTQLACTPTGTLTAHSYADATRYPTAPVAVFSSIDPWTGDILFGFNNLCGSANTGTPATGGAPNVLVVAINPLNYPLGATQIEWVGGDLNGNNTAVLGSNATCPAATVGPLEFCVVLNDQEADLGWLRVPRLEQFQGFSQLKGLTTVGP